MMGKSLKYSADDIRFDLPKEQRLSANDLRQLICLHVGRVGSGYRAIINGYTFELPPNIPTIADARKVAVELAIKEMATAAKELIDKYFD